MTRLALLLLALAVWTGLVAMLLHVAMPLPASDVRELARDMSPCGTDEALPAPFAVTAEDFRP